MCFFFKKDLYCQWRATVWYLPDIAGLGLLHSNDTPMALTHELWSQPAKGSEHIILCDDVILL